MGRTYPITVYPVHSGMTQLVGHVAFQKDFVASFNATTNDGFHELPFSGYSLSVAVVRDEDNKPCGAHAGVFRGTESAAMLAVALNTDVASTLWPKLEAAYLKLSDYGFPRGADWASPRMPARTPWVSWFPIGGALNDPTVEAIVRDWAVVFRYVSESDSIAS